MSEMGTTSASSFAQRDFKSDSSHHIDAEGACDLVNVADAVDGELNADRTLVVPSPRWRSL